MKYSDDFSSDLDDGDISSSFSDANNSPAPVQKLKKSVASKSKPGSHNDGKTVEEIYQKKTQLEHILLRPDTYIGSIEAQTQQMWVLDQDNEKFVLKNIQFVPGFYKIFDEILVNAADNKIRDPTMDTLKVKIDKENNEISVFNNGKGIPVQIHAKEGVYVPELIFGHLLTSSNYDDDQKKVTGGRNGYGAKLCNIFSKEFIVETADKTVGKKFKQVFSDNMSRKSEPQLTKWTQDDFTRITFKPDLERFGMSSFDDDIESLFKKRVYDLAGCVTGIKVFLNDERIKVKGFRPYIDMYLKDNNTENNGSKFPIIHEVVNDRWEIAFTISDGQFQQVSFVNSISTSKGGTHVNHVTDQIVNRLLEHLKKKNKSVTLKPFQVKNHISLFVNALIENPSFDSQTKDNMTLRASAFGSKCDLDEDFFKKVMKSGVLDSILSWAKFKQEQQLKKTDGHKTSRITGIAKLDDANNAGTRNASKCTLILTEGDSAKALAVAGISVVGRDNYGVFPLRGKLLNVRDATSKQILENQEIQYVKQIIGLQQGKTYSSVESLRYGHVMIMTDQDHDGSHIKGLIINFFDRFWPSLLKIPGFLMEFITPIVKVSKGNKELCFYTIPQYESWKEDNNNGKDWNIKYYKGLGTSTTQDAKKYFSNLDKHAKAFASESDGDRKLVDMAFSKSKIEDRKEWLRHFQPGTFMEHNVKEITISNFINKELILFSMADNGRSIPNMMDGFKPGHRKILFSCFKRNLKNEIKVAQLAGYVSEHSAYHHGEQSLCSSIVGLAQDFVGSNNCNLLDPSGQFGTRIQGGKDAASARYIFTKLNPITRLIFHPQDDALLQYLNEDGQDIEPEWYAPILPMVLVNGAEGIGTGWSTFVPNFNPSDIVSNIKNIILGKPTEKMHPWYRGFNGFIEQVAEDKYRVSGCIRKIDETCLEITELPIRTWTQPFKEHLETLLKGDGKTAAFIKDYKEYHTDNKVHFKVYLSPENMAIAEQEGFDKRFKISSNLSTGNMVCFSSDGRIKKYSDVEEILREFYDIRLRLYQKRKEFLADQLTNEWTKLDNKVKFVLEIIHGKLVIQNRKKKDILKELQVRGYKTFSKKAKVDGQQQQQSQQQDDEAESDQVIVSLTDGYDYLLSMPLWSLTMEKVEKLRSEKDQKEQELNILLGKAPKDLWIEDLDAFTTKWNDVCKGYESRSVTTVNMTAMEQVNMKKEKLAERKKKTILTKGEIKSGTSSHSGSPIASSRSSSLANSPGGLKKSIASKAPSKKATMPVIKEKSDAMNICEDEDSVDEMSLPLSQRIERMLVKQSSLASASQKNKPSVAAAVSSSSTTLTSKMKALDLKDDAVSSVVGKPTTTRKKPTKKIISDDEDSDDYMTSAVSIEKKKKSITGAAKNENKKPISTNIAPTKATKKVTTKVTSTATKKPIGSKRDYSSSSNVSVPLSPIAITTIAPKRSAFVRKKPIYTMSSEDEESESDSFSFKGDDDEEDDFDDDDGDFDEEVRV